MGVIGHLTMVKTRSARRLVGRGLLAMLPLAGVLGCGGGDHLSCATTMLEVEMTAPLVSLSEAEKSNLCDVSACRFGGYGTRTRCSTGPAVMIAASRQRCLAGTTTNPACTATVGDLLRCEDALKVSPCFLTLLQAPECAPLSDIACLIVTPNASSMAFLDLPQ
jgi:hypothetical protein